MINSILIVEDEPNLLESISTIFEMQDFKVYKADQGKLAIGILNDRQVDIIVCDINLPDISGYEVLNYVKSERRFFKIPLIFLSAYAAPSDIEKGMKSGAQDYFTKPFSGKKLIDAVKTRIQQTANHRQNED